MMELKNEQSDWTKQTIATLVSQNYRIAEALHFLGIRFQDYVSYTWQELCAERGLQPDILVREMNVVGLNPSESNLKLIQYPAELVLAYLRHAHHQFIKVRLPFILQLLDQTDYTGLDANNVAHDLKLIFPDFAQDFIWHVYEEEDELFSYIELLIQAVKGKAKLSQVYYAMEKQSINHFANEHEIHKNEMIGLRQLTNNYEASQDAPLGIKVLFAELSILESELIVHANIENRILFPKALKLEHEVRYHLLFRSKLN